MPLIDLWAGLKDVSRKPGEGKVAIEFRSENLLFSPDERALAQEMATAAAQQIASNLKSGLAPDGSPLPGLAAATLERRDFEAGQGARGGQAADRVRDSAARAKAIRNYKRDYTASRLGSFTPRAGGPRGNVSGMLANSFVARPSRDGKGFTVYVAAKRGKPRPGDRISALESVFRGVQIWNQRAATTPAMMRAMRRAVGGMLGKRASSLLRRLLDTSAAVQEIAEESEE